MRIRSLGLVFYRALALRAFLFVSEDSCTSLLQLKHPDSFLATLIQFRFLALYRSGLRDWGTVNGTQTGISKHSFKSNKNCHILQSQLGRRLDLAICPTW